MRPHTRAMVAAITFALVAGKKAAGVYDHATGHIRQIAAEARGGQVQGVDGDRGVAFGGTLPELYDAGDKAYLSVEIDGSEAKGYDRGSSSFFTAQTSGGLVQVFDHEHGAWFAYDIQDASAEQSFHRS